MSGQQSYDHVRMIEHATTQTNIMNRLEELKQESIHAINSVAEIWKEHGSNAAQEAHQQIALAFQQVFATIGRHGQAIQGASQNAEHTDMAAAAGFRNL
ncbi:hypothetical protein [Mycolicibacterium lutetiense]|uniref:Uncharacterized protein YukE n=1 Tax=Mycolicibacterium lutetiense TaxID=1641992 RepID=A0ABS5A3G2_9MYCO|nr:hypothetical protein [Mycolicibacterium lutetiense]MBP2456304.1 uncharacterized protein YukE [Mycolicibacterium lutetiense]